MLLIIDEWSDVRQSKLAEQCHSSRQHMHDLVARLRQLGLVKTWSDPKRREVRAMLGRFGVRHQAALTALLEQLETALQVWARSPHLFDD